MQMNRFGQAVETFNQVTSSHPDAFIGHLLKGDSLLAMNRDYEALESYQSALKLDPLNGL